MGVEGIILAAGLSERAHSYKMTLPFNNKTVIESTIDGMLEYCIRVIVVGGYRYEFLKPIIGRYKGVELVYNEDYLKGMYSSVKKGMSMIREDRFFFTPGDYPLITGEVYKKLLSSVASVAIPVYEGKKGHPLLLHSSIAYEVLHNDEYKTLRDALRDKDTALIPVSCKGIIMDLDTKSDYENLLKQVIHC